MAKIFKIFKLFILFGLLVTNTFQFVFYRRTQRAWYRLPSVEMTVVETKLIDHLKVNGGREYKAEVRFTYEYDGKDYESDTAALHGPLMFPLWNYEWQLLKK